MDISKNILAPFATSTTDDGSNLIIDVNSFVTRLLLFDKYNIETSMFRDMVMLINTFEAEGLIDLLESGIISLYADPLTYGQFNREDPLRSNISYPTEGRNGGDFLPLLHYEPVVVTMPDRADYIDRCLQNVDLVKINPKTKSKLKQSLAKRMIDVGEQDRMESYPWMRTALLDNNGVVTATLSNVVKDKTGHSLVPTNFDYKIRQSGESGFAVDTNLGRIFNLSDLEEHKIFETTVLSVGGFYKRVELMKKFNSIAWFSEANSLVLEAEMKLANDEFNSDTQEKRLTRILELKGLPALTPNSKIDANTLLRIRDTRECREFRDWLRESDNKTDTDIVNELNSFKNSVSSILNSPQTRAMRLILPLAMKGTAAVAATLGDVGLQFVYDKFFSKNGPIAFINNKLPSFWDNDPYKN